MARLHEYQAKALLRDRGLPAPPGQAVSTADEARDVADQLGGRVVLKVQAWITGRAARGGIQFAEPPTEAHDRAAQLRELRVGTLPVREVRRGRASGVHAVLGV